MSEPVLSPLELAAVKYQDAAKRLRLAEVAYEESSAAFSKASDETEYARELLRDARLNLLEVAHRETTPK